MKLRDMSVLLNTISLFWDSKWMLFSGKRKWVSLQKAEKSVQREDIRAHYRDPQSGKGGVGGFTIL